MWIFKFGVPILGVLGFGHAVYEVFTDRIDAEKMGMPRSALRMFGLCNLFMTVSWIIIFFGLMGDGTWPKALAIFVTGMYIFDYVVSIPLYKNAGDEFFKIWAGAAGIILILYIFWL